MRYGDISVACEFTRASAFASAALRTARLANTNNCPTLARDCDSADDQA
jgi:hypothetical protein